MKKSVNVTRRDLNIFDRNFELYTVVANYDSKDFSTQFDTKTDILCTCRKTRRHTREGFKGSRKVFTESVGSVKILPKRKTRRVYASDTRDTGVGSSTVLPEHKEKHNECSFYENNKTSSKCVGGVWEPIKIPTISKRLSPIIQTKSDTTSPIDIQSERNKEKKEIERININKYSSDSLVQRIHNLDDPNYKSKVSIDVMENKLEREYRKMFATKSIKDDLKRASVLRRRFESLRKCLSKESKDKAPKSLIHKDVSIASDPPSLEAKSYSNTNIFSPYTSFTEPVKNPVVSIKKSPERRQSTDGVDSDCQSVRGMFKLWGRKFNLEDDISNDGKRNNFDVKNNGKLPENVVDIVVPDKIGRSKRKKFFFFNKRSREKHFKPKVTTGRCEVDSLKIKIDSKYELENDIMRKSWLKKFLSTKVDSRRSVKIRWNNRMYSSSSTVCDFIDCIYNRIVIGSKSEIINSNNFMPQTIQAWMVPEIIPQIKIKPRKNIEVTYLDRKWYIDKTHRGNKIELVLQSNIIKGGDKSSDYILIDIPKGYFTDSMDSNQSDEQVFRITDYESPNSKVSVSKQNLDTGDHVSLKNYENDEKCAKNVEQLVGEENVVQNDDPYDENEAKCDRNDRSCEKYVKNNEQLNGDEHFVKNDYNYVENSEKFDKNDENIEDKDEYCVENDENVKDEAIQESLPKYCDVIGVGIITQRDIRDIKKPTLKIQDSDSESAHNLAPRKKCEFAESYLQDYCRNWIPLGIDFFSWCISDTQLRSENNSNSSLNNQGDGSKSCPNMFDDSVFSSYNSSCSHCVDLDVEEKEPKKQNFLTKFFGKCDISSTEAQSNSELKRFQPKDSIEVFKRRQIYSEGYNSKWNKLCLKTSPKEEDPNMDSKPKKHVALPECEPREVNEQPCNKCFPGILNLSGTKPCKKKQKHTCVIPDPVCAIPSKPTCSNICSKEYCPPCAKDKGKKGKPCMGKSPPVCGKCSPLTPSEILELKKQSPESPSLPQKCPKCKTSILPQKCIKCCTPVLPKKCPKCSATVIPMKCAKCSRPIVPQKCPKCPSPTVPIQCPSCGMDMMPQKCPKCCTYLVPQNCPRCSSQIMPTKCPVCSSEVQPPTCPKCSDPIPQKCPKCSPPILSKCPKCCFPTPPPKCPQCRTEVSPKRCKQCSTSVLPQSCPKCSCEISPQTCPKCLAEVVPQKCPKCSPRSPNKKVESPPNCPLCSSQLVTQKCPKCSSTISQPKCPNCNTQVPSRKCAHCSTPVQPKSCPKCPKSCSPISVQKCPNCCIPLLPQKCPNCSMLLHPKSVSQTSIQSHPKSPRLSKRASTQSIPKCCNPCTINKANSPGVKGMPNPSPTKKLPQTASKQSIQCSKNCPNRSNSNLSRQSSFSKKQTPSTTELREGYNIKVQDEDGQTLYERIDYKKCDKQSQQLQNKICGDSYIHRVSTPSVILNKVALNENYDGQKSTSSLDNLIEINLTLKFKQGDKTEVNICNPDTQRDEKDIIKPKEIFHMQDQTKESIDHTEKNDVNIKIMIKNCGNDDKSKHLQIDNSNQNNEFSKNISNKFQTVSTGYSEFVIEQALDERNCSDNTKRDNLEGKTLVSSIDTEKTISSIKNDTDFDLKTDLSDRDVTDKSETDEDKIDNYLNETIKKLRNKREKKEMLKKLFEKVPFDNKTRGNVKSVRRMLQAILTSDSDSSVKCIKPHFRRSDSLTNFFDFDSRKREREEKREILYPSKENSDSDAPNRCMCSALAAKLNMNRNPCCCNERTTDSLKTNVQTQDSFKQTYVTTNVSTIVKKGEAHVGFDSDSENDSFVDILQTEELKKAVLEIYTEKTFTNEGTRFIARLPKFVFISD